jgi:hypothetical protein
VWQTGQKVNQNLTKQADIQQKVMNIQTLSSCHSAPKVGFLPIKLSKTDSPKITSWDNFIYSLNAGQIWQNTDYRIGPYILNATPKQWPAYETTARYWLQIDFDASETNGLSVEAAKTDVVFFCTYLERHNLAYGRDFQVYFSGKKGFKVIFNWLTPEAPGWHHHFFLWATGLRGQYPTLDASIYAHKQPLRGPFAKHPDGNRWQIPLTLTELLFSTPEELAFKASVPPTITDIRPYLPSLAEAPENFTTWVNEIRIDGELAELERVAPKALRNYSYNLTQAITDIGWDVSKEKESCFVLKTCPCCGRAGTAYITKGGYLKCFRASCQANSGISFRDWAKQYGLTPNDYCNPLVTDILPIIGPQNPQVGIEAARSLLDNDVHVYIKGFEPMAFRWKGRLYRISPGVGKTEVFIRAINQLIQAGHRIIFSGATHAQVRELESRLLALGTIDPGKIIRIEGRNGEDTATRSKNCFNFGACLEAQRRGYSAGKTVCSHCPHTRAQKCPYMAQFDRLYQTQGGYLVLTTHDMALRLHNDKTNKIPADLIILDENPFNALKGTREFKPTTLAVGWQNLLPALNTFVGFMNHALTKSVERGVRQKQGHVMRNQELARWLSLIAEKGGFNLISILEKAVDEANELDRITFGYEPGSLYEKVIQLPDRRLYELAVILLEEVTAWKGGKEYNHRVVMSACQKETGWESEFIIRTVEPYRHDTPLIFLDAYGDPGIYGQFFPAHDLTTVDIAAKLSDQVSLKQVQTSTSKSGLRDLDAKTEKYLLPELANLRGQKTLIYLHLGNKQAVKEAIRVALDLKPSYLHADTLRGDDGTVISLKHFRQDRGDDSYKDYDNVVTFGTPFPDRGPVLDELSALCHANKDPKRISDDPAGAGSRRYEFADPRLDGYIKAIREYEILQAIYRLRPCSADSPKKVIILSTLDMTPYLPGLAVVNPRKKDHSDLVAFMTDCLSELGFWTDSLIATGIDLLTKPNYKNIIGNLNDNKSLDGIPIRYTLLIGKHANVLTSLPKSVVGSLWYRELRDEVVAGVPLLSTKELLTIGDGSLFRFKVWGDLAGFNAVFMGLTVLKRLATEEQPEPVVTVESLRARNRGRRSRWVGPRREERARPGVVLGGERLPLRGMVLRE